MAPNHPINLLARVLRGIRNYPVPAFATIGLMVGVILVFGAGRYDLASVVWYATLIIGGAPVVYQTGREIFQRKFASDIVAMLAIIGAIITGEPFAGVIIVIMQTGGEALEDYGFRRASSSLEELTARAPRIAHRKNDDSIQDIDANQVKIEETLVVRHGDLIPVDGVLVGASAEIDESALTGEPLSRARTAGDRLLSGSVNVGHAFEMKATKVAGESQYAKIVELVRKAEGDKPPIQRLADRYAVWFTPLTLVIAGFGWAITQNPDTAVAVLVVATPCPLILATPLAVISGINHALKEGIVMKSGAAIEQIGKGRIVVFDKTGTLTYGTPVVEFIAPFNGDSEEELLRMAGGVEQLSSHPLAISLANEAEERFGKLPYPTEFKETPGGGVEASLAGERILIGARRFCESKIGKKLDGSVTEVLNKVQTQGRLISFMVKGDKPAGAIVFHDQLRAGVPVMMNRLRELGVERTVMLTGDNEANAALIANEAGIDHVAASLLPSEKVEEVKRLNIQYGKAIMVGDGINDAPSLAAATVGVAMGAHGTGIAAEAADIVLLEDDVTKVGDSIQIGQRTLAVAMQSIYFGLGGSFVLMVIASFGFIPPAIGALFQEVLDITVILNAVRADPRHTKGSQKH